MKKAIPVLTLADLFAPAADSKSLPTPKFEREILIAKAAAKVKVRSESPWRSTRIVMFMQQVECDCGYTHFAPATEGITVEFQHKRQPETKHYVSNHPSINNPNLAQEIEYRISYSSACHECFPRNLHTPIEPFAYKPIHKDKQERAGQALPEPQAMPTTTTKTELPAPPPFLDLSAVIASLKAQPKA